ncbi:MAG TPA: hypothetical protein VIH76_16430 [Candidatus Acidoferrales bacterium]
MSKHSIATLSIIIIVVFCSVPSGSIWSRTTPPECQTKATSSARSKTYAQYAKKLYGPADFKVIKTTDAVEGQVATGVVLREEKDQSELVLDLQPCQPDLHVEVFTKPYKKTGTNETVKCNGKPFPTYRVEQKKAAF